MCCSGGRCVFDDLHLSNLGLYFKVEENKSSSSSSSSSLEEDQPPGRDSWTTATVQSTAVTSSSGGPATMTSQSIDSFLTPSSSSAGCTQQDYEILKAIISIVVISCIMYKTNNIYIKYKLDYVTQDNLLLYSHARLSSMDDGHSNTGSKDYLVSLMFSHYDLNNNGLLESEELAKVNLYFNYFLKKAIMM